MIKKNYYDILSRLNIIASFIFLLTSNFIKNPYWGIGAIILITFALFFYCIADFNKRVGFSMFAACLFTFQLSGIAMPIFIGDTNWMMGFTEIEYVKICNCLFVTVFFLIIGTDLFERYCFVWKKEKKNKLLGDSSFNIRTIQNCAFVLCIFSSIISAIGESARLFFALSNGYMALYGGYTLPSFIIRMQIVSRMSLFIGLAANPPKKHIYIYLFMGLPVVIMNLIEGSRSSIVAYAIFFIYYFYVYSDWKKKKIDKSRKPKAIKKMIFTIIIGVCVAVPLLYIWGYTRVDSAYETLSNPLEGVVRFFSSQGGSVALIGKAIRYKGELPGVCYSLGSIVDRIQGNVYPAYTIEAALKTNNFSAIMSYMENSYNFLTLHIGVGSSYIAEVFYDFGYIGLVGVNIIIAYILKLLTSFENVSVLKRSIIFVIFYYMLTIPRGTLLSPIEYVFSGSAILTIAMLFALGKMRL